MSDRLRTVNSQTAIRTLVTAEALAILLAIALGNDPDRIVNFATIVISLTTLFVLTLFHREALDAQSQLHREVMGEQAQLRLLQSRPQVLVYFVRKPNPETSRDSLVLVIEHFGGGPALDVQFAFSPPLVNHEGKTFADEPPFSTGIAVMAPGFRREIDFDDYYRFHDRAGLTRIVGSLGHPIEPTRLSFEATVTLRDPIGDDHDYVTRYKIDLTDLMPYTMANFPNAEPRS